MSVLLKWTWLVSAVALSSGSVLQTPTKDGTFELLILHNNDMHARFEQTSQLSGVCTPAERDAGKCYGGFPRVATVVKEARRAAASGEGPPVLYLNAGDTYTGTAWFTLYKWKIAAEFINAIQPDAVSLGNNEFATGERDLSPFLKTLRTPILSSNVIPNTDQQNIQKSIVLDINGIKVGIVGYLGLDTAVLDNSNNIEYIDEVLAVREEVSNLQKNKVNIIIALGHSDPSKDVEIAKEVEGIDLVIGGHKNKYFWNGTSAETVSPISDKVVSVTNNSGKKVPIFHSFAYNEYLGKLKIVFDKQGEIIEYNLNPVLLDSSITQDAEFIQIIQNYKDIISKDASEIIGNTAVVLDGDSCRLEECNLGNLITDAIVHYHATLFEGDQPWTDAPIAIIHGGAIAGSIAPSNRPASLTRGDLLAVLPSEGGITAVTMTGTRLIQLLEHSAAVTGTSDGYLQFSGIRVVYNFQNEIGSRVVTALARCGSCYVPEFYIIEDNRSYKVLMPASLLNERYGYNMLSDLPQEELPYDEVTCVAEYIRTRSPIYPEVAGRITQDGRDSAAPLSSSITVLCLIVLAFITN